jgi:hypothetical protein
MKRCPVDRRLNFGRVRDIVGWNQIDREAVEFTDDVGVFGILFAAVGQYLVADLEPVRFQLLAVEIRRETDKQIDIAVTSQPRVAGGRADLYHVCLDWERRDSLACAGHEHVDGCVECVAFGVIWLDALVDAVDNCVELLAHSIRLPASA